MTAASSFQPLVRESFKFFLRARGAEADLDKNSILILRCTLETLSIENFNSLKTDKRH